MRPLPLVRDAPCLFWWHTLTTGFLSRAAMLHVSRTELHGKPLGAGDLVVAVMDVIDKNTEQKYLREVDTGDFQTWQFCNTANHFILWYRHPHEAISTRSPGTCANAPPVSQHSHCSCCNRRRLDTKAAVEPARSHPAPKASLPANSYSAHLR